MSETNFEWIAIPGSLLLIFGTEPLLRKLGINLNDSVAEKVTGSVVALFFCFCVLVFLF